MLVVGNVIFEFRRKFGIGNVGSGVIDKVEVMGKQEIIREEYCDGDRIRGFSLKLIKMNIKGGGLNL